MKTNFSSDFSLFAITLDGGVSIKVPSRVITNDCWPINKRLDSSGDLSPPWLSSHLRLSGVKTLPGVYLKNKIYR